MPKRSHKWIEDVFKAARLAGDKGFRAGFATWFVRDGADCSGNEQHRGKKVLCECRDDGRVYLHWSYKWPGVEERVK